MSTNKLSILLEVVTDPDSNKSYIKSKATISGQDQDDSSHLGDYELHCLFRRIDVSELEISYNGQVLPLSPRITMTILRFMQGYTFNIQIEHQQMKDINRLGLYGLVNIKSLLSSKGESNLKLIDGSDLSQAAPGLAPGATIWFCYDRTRSLRAPGIWLGHDLLMRVGLTGTLVFDQVGEQLKPLETLNGESGDASGLPTMYYVDNCVVRGGELVAPAYQLTRRDDMQIMPMPPKQEKISMRSCC